MDVLGNLKKVLSFVFRSGVHTITIKGADAPDAPTKDMVLNFRDGNASQNLVTDSSIDTLINKTISSASNTITIDADVAAVTNIDNDEIKAGAAIDVTKLHDGNVDNTEFGYLDGVTSSIQTQLNDGAQNLADHISDAVDAHDATAVSYDNSVSGLTAIEVQAAIDEVEARVDTAESTITDLGTDKADKTTTITAGAGLSGGGDLSASRTIDVNVDNSSIEIDADTLQIKDDGVTTSKIINDAVTTSKILNSNVTTPKIADNAVTAAKLDGSVAGDGLVLDGVDNSINVNVDNSTLEIDTDQVRIADAGVVTAKIADGAVTSDKLATDSVITAKIANANVTNAKLASDIDATKLASGTVTDARLSANVNLLDADQTVSGEKTYDKVVLGDSNVVNNNASATLAEPNKSVVRLTGTPGVTSITTITATGVSTNRYIQLQNDTASAFSVEDGSGNIVTGTGQNLELASEAVIILRYDGTNWRVVGGSGGGAGGIATEFYIHSALPATLSPDIRYIVDISSGDAAAIMPASDALNDGKVIEVWPVNNPGGGKITLTAATSHNFNDPDLGQDSVYELDVGSAEFVIRDTGDLYEVRDAYWSAGFDLQEASASQSGVVTTGAQTFAGDKTFEGGVFFQQKLVVSVGSATTISGGVIPTPTTTVVVVDTEAAAATDELDTIGPGDDGQIIIVRTASSTRDVTVKDVTGNIVLNGDFSLNQARDTLTLIYLASVNQWLELSRSDNA